MQRLLAGICLAVLLLMLAVTIQASLRHNIVDAARLLWPDPWFRATLADAYCGFLFFWLWVAWRERTPARGVLWLLLIMTLGNIAMAGYLLWQLRRLRPGDGVEALLLRREARAP
jgi:hypothetical protein